MFELTFPRMGLMVADLFIRAFVTHNTDRLDGQEDGEGLTDLVV